MDPVEQQVPQPAAQSVESNIPVRRSKISRKIVIISAVILMLLAGLAVLLLMQKPESTVTGKLPPSEPKNVLLATVDDEKKIFSNDVREYALKYVSQSAFNNETMQVFLDKAIERSILDIESSKRKINIEESLVLQEIGDLKPTEKTYQRERDDIYYGLLKARISASLITAAIFYRISYWIPAPTDPEASYQNYTVEKEALDKAIQEIYNLVSTGGDPYETTKSTFNKYPLIQNRIAFNGGIFKTITDTDEAKQPIRVESDKIKYTGKYFSDIVMSMAPGSTKLIVDPDQHGAAVVKMVSKENGEFASYDEFITKRRSEIVVIHKKL